MNTPDNQLHATIRRNGVSRRAFLKYCGALASLLALPNAAAATIAKALETIPRQSVIWLSFQECTGCTESLTRSHAPTLEGLIFDHLSLDYHHTLQAASGEGAEAAREAAIKRFYGKYLVVVDGAIPLGHAGSGCTIAGRSSLDLLQECAKGAAAIIAVGTCAAFGGLPKALPNPTGATSVMALMDDGLIAHRPLVNIPGCPPIPVATSAMLAHYLAFGEFPDLDELARPRVFYERTIHERCSRLHYFEQGKFAKRFDDEGAKKGWCLYELGCKGPLTHNVCATVKWNGGTSFPIESGHPCLGCSEPEFWDKGGFYESLLPEPATDLAAADKTRLGEEVFESNCVYCHSVSTTSFKTELDRIPELFGPDAPRAHRFDISDEELKNIVDYLKGLDGTSQR